MYVATNHARSRAEFSCEAPGASSVFLVGRFGGNRTESHLMRKMPDGEWVTVLELPPGRFPYKFVVIYRSTIDVRDNQSALAARWQQWPASNHRMQSLNSRPRVRRVSVDG